MDKQMDRQMDRIAISISRVSVLMHDKKPDHYEYDFLA